MSARGWRISALLLAAGLWLIGVVIDKALPSEDGTYAGFWYTDPVGTQGPPICFFVPMGS